jgi:nicotinic acid phosphoribosyltransferase
VLTDLYEVTMALSYVREGMTAPATFSLFVRNLPHDRGCPRRLRHRTVPGPSATYSCWRGGAGCGLTQATIVVSGGLDEYAVDELVLNHCGRRRRC